MKREPSCRACGATLEHTFVDLGVSPLCERFLTASQLDEMEPFYPLHVWLCHRCFLVQLQVYVPPEEIFTDYAYFSSYSDSWLAHARAYTEKMVSRFRLDSQSQVMEAASNDGYLLQYFVQKGIPALGIEPAENVAAAAREKGVATEECFLGAETAKTLVETHGQADLVLGNNVLAHVPDIIDFVQGLKTLLKPDGVLTMEFPHLLRLIEGNQFDTIYHEHFSYLSLTAVERLFRAQGLRLFDVEQLPTHGGSLRIYAAHDSSTRHRETGAVAALLAEEQSVGTTSLTYYAAFQEKVIQTKNDLLQFLINARREGKSIAGYGAPGKGNTLLNYCGIRQDLLAYTVDRNPYKHGRFCPGTRIPIYGVERITETKPDFLLIMPWNLKDEIAAQMSGIRAWGGRFVVAIPEVIVF